jgi:hypothetical protein
MKWIKYDGSPFEGERIFKFKCGDVQKRFFYTFPEDDVVRNNLNWDQVFYLDESPSYSKEDMREAMLKALNHGKGIMAWYQLQGKVGEAPLTPECFIEDYLEWIKEREGK